MINWLDFFYFFTCGAALFLSGLGLWFTVIMPGIGRGFAPSDDSEPHIALKNIRQRLEMMCAGSLAITRGDGGGTIVTVTIPDAALSHPAKVKLC